MGSGRCACRADASFEGLREDVNRSCEREASLRFDRKGKVGGAEGAWVMQTTRLRNDERMQRRPGLGSCASSRRKVRTVTVVRNNGGPD